MPASEASGCSEATMPLRPKTGLRRETNNMGSDDDIADRASRRFGSQYVLFGFKGPLGGGECLPVLQGSTTPPVAAV
eukprot:7010215-Pyramimonas_sp.AAC.1